MSNGAEHLRLVQPDAEPVDPYVGSTVDGRYHVEKVLGRGGMGVVYACKHVVLGKRLAIKVLKSDVSKDQEIITRFRQEAQSASAIGSQHIIDISDFGSLPDGSTYFVMEYLQGKELTKAIETEQPIGTARVIHIAQQLCEALGAAHERGIVHRDMKPDNVFLIPRGADKDFVKVLDFGIAKVGGASSKLTRAGQVFGTPHYMSPEQCSGQQVDHRTDIYALGVILYEMACGRVPFDADNLMGILTKHIYEQPLPPHQLPPPVAVPPGLEAVILKCLAKQADARYQSMAEVKADLDVLAQGHTPQAVIEAVQRTTGAHPTKDPTGRHQVGLQVEVGAPSPPPPSRLPWIAAGLLGLLALAGAAVGAWFVLHRSSPPPAHARVEPPPPIATPPVVERPVEPVVEPSIEVAENEPPPPVAQPIRITTDPPVVEVLGEDQVTLGNTPFELERPAAGESMVIMLRHPDFQDHTLRVSRLTQAEVHISMIRRSRSSSRSHTSSTQAPTTQTPVQNPTTTSAPPPPPIEPPPRPNTAPNSEVLDPWAR